MSQTRRFGRKALWSGATAAAVVPLLANSKSRQVIQDLVLPFVLLLTYRAIRLAKGRTPSLDDFVAQTPDLVFQISTFSGLGGHFSVQNGRLRFRPTLHPSPTAEQKWLSGWAAVRTLANGTTTAQIQAFEAAQYRLTGDGTAALWFMELLLRARASR